MDFRAIAYEKKWSMGTVLVLHFISFMQHKNRPYVAPMFHLLLIHSFCKRLPWMDFLLLYDMEFPLFLILYPTIPR